MTFLMDTGSPYILVPQGWNVQQIPTSGGTCEWCGSPRDLVWTVPPLAWPASTGSRYISTLLCVDRAACNERKRHPRFIVTMPEAQS
jgi:hypothetical protein